MALSPVILPEPDQRRLDRLRRLARLYDAGLRVPGTRFEVGLDPLFGLVPGIGDAVGAVPLAGDLFDAAWKANLKNVRLLERHLADPRGAHRGSRRFLVVLAVAILLLTAGSVALALYLLRAFIRFIAG